MFGSIQNQYLIQSSCDEFFSGSSNRPYSDHLPEIFLLKAIKPPTHDLDSGVSTRERKVLGSVHNKPLSAFGSPASSSFRKGSSTRSTYSPYSDRSESKRSLGIASTFASPRRYTEIVDVVPFQPLEPDVIRPIQPLQVDFDPQEIELISEHHVLSNVNIIPLFPNAVNLFQQLIFILYFVFLDVVVHCIHQIYLHYSYKPSAEDYHQDTVPPFEADSQVDNQNDSEDEQFVEMLIGGAPGLDYNYNSHTLDFTRHHHYPIVDSFPNRGSDPIIVRSHLFPGYSPTVLNTQGDIPVLSNYHSRCFARYKYPKWQFSRIQSEPEEWSSDNPQVIINECTIQYDDQALEEEENEMEEVQLQLPGVKLEVKTKKTRPVVEKVKVNGESFMRYSILPKGY